MRKIILVLGIIVVVFGTWWAASYFGLFAQNKLQQTFTDIEEKDSPEIQPKSVELKYEVMAEGLEVPWSIVFTSEQRILVAERPGRIRAIVNGQLLPQALLTFPDVKSGGEEGLMGMVKDPDYENNQYLYVCYAYQDNGFKDRVVRLIDTQTEIMTDKVLLENIPAATFHAGCALGFGPDGKLYISTGDAGQKDQAQDQNSLAGKILRLNSDGSVPSDNPFGNPVWSLGHRNPQGFDWYPNTEIMYESEHGPSIFDGPAGGDEINVIEVGKNYGWPRVHHQESEVGMVDPALGFTPAIAPASGHFYSGSLIPQFSNAFLVGMLKGEGILVVKPDPSNPGQVASFEQLKLEYGRIRAVTEGPDGAIYFSTSNQDGRGKVQTGDDKIIRIVPQ